MPGTGTRSLIRRRGESCQLQEFTPGATDPNYHIPADTRDPIRPVKAIRDDRPPERTVRTTGGEEVRVDVVFHVADGEEPAMPEEDPTQEHRRPVMIDAKGVRYEVVHVSGLELGTRRLFAEKLR